MSFFTESVAANSLLLRMAEESLEFAYEGGGVTPVQYPYTSGWRILSFILLAFVDGTVCLHRDGHPDHEVKNGQVVCVEPGIRHCLDVMQKRPGYSIWSHVSFTICSTISVTDILRPPLIFKSTTARKIEKINREFAELNTEPHPTLRNVFQKRALAFQLLVIITEHAELRPGTAEYLTKVERLAPTLAYLKENFARPIDLSVLAQMAGLSPSRFHAVFEDTLGQPPGRYLQKLRLQRARQMLLGNASVGEIATASGYQDVFHFSRIFKKHFNVSPSHYRAQAKSGF